MPPSDEHTPQVPHDKRHLLYDELLPWAVCGGVVFWLFATLACAQDMHHHPGANAAVDQFYSTWFRPDAPGASCCNRADCYVPQRITFHDGYWWAERREDRKMIRIPDAKIEQNRDSPDHRSHLCAPPAETPAGLHDTVFCFILGEGT